MNAFRSTAWLLVATAGFSACKHVPSQKDQQGSQIHYDLGITAQQNGDVQGALAEFQQSVKMDPTFPEVHNALAILLHISFKKTEDAIFHYREAIKLRPAFSEAKSNLANVYLDLGRYDEAIPLYEEALNDMLYPTPYIAQSNLGWALYKKGKKQRGIEQIRAAVTTNPKFCLGYRNLGVIFEEQGDTTESCKQFGRYRDQCPEVADAYYREGLCLVKLGQPEQARDRFAKCQEKASSVNLKDDCRLYTERLSGQ